MSSLIGGLSSTLHEMTLSCKLSGLGATNRCDGSPRMHTCFCRNWSQVVSFIMMADEGGTEAPLRGRGRGRAGSTQPGRDGQRQGFGRGGAHWTGEDAGGWRGIDGIDGLHIAQRGASQSRDGLCRSTTCALEAARPTSERRGARSSRSRSKPPRSASPKGCSSGAIPRLSCVPTVCLDKDPASHSRVHTTANVGRANAALLVPLPKQLCSLVSPLRLNSRYIPSTCLTSLPAVCLLVDLSVIALCISITVCFGIADTMIFI